MFVCVFVYAYVCVRVCVRVCVCECVRGVRAYCWHLYDAMLQELYTGVKDPTDVIEKYAAMWSYQPLFDGRRTRWWC